MLDNEIREQLVQYLALLENNIVFKASLDDSQKSQEMLSFLEEVQQLSELITIEKVTLKRTPSFMINQGATDSGIIFAGIPLGHEFTSFVLALLQVSGRAPKVSEKLIKVIKSIDQEYHFETYVSLTCHNCPDVVQALNIMSVLNPHITHTMIDGGIFSDEIAEKEIMGVPTVYLNGTLFHNGRSSLEEILDKLQVSLTDEVAMQKEPFDVLVVGAGPAGASAAIYAARKGIRTGLVADRFGGQVNDTLGIENFISMTYTEGPKLAQALENHVTEYPVDVMKARKATKLVKNNLFELILDNGVVLESKTVIISTGARWRNINVPGEIEFKNKGVAYCPHCDGPLFKGKDVAVIGGGNSGVEAAIDLANVVNHVTVIEFLPELKADKVLQEKLFSLPNVTVITNAQTTAITGNTIVDGLSYINRTTQEEVHLSLHGVFILVGLVPNTEWLEDVVAKTPHGEIIIDDHGMTNIAGVFAAGDCTTSIYKQIIISMGSGATASLGAFDYLIRNT